MQLLLTFIIASIVNVILQTIKSLVTIKCGKWLSALVNAVVFGFYTWVVVLTVCDLSLWTKIIITALCNFVGVWVVKWGEERSRKDKMWLVKITIPKPFGKKVASYLKDENISYSQIEIDKYIIFDTYCNTQEETVKVLNTCKENNGKSFAAENKLT